MSENLTVTFRVPLGLALSKYVLEPTHLQVLSLVLEWHPSLVADCYAARREQIIHPSPSAFPAISVSSKAIPSLSALEPCGGRFPRHPWETESQLQISYRVHPVTSKSS